MKVDTSRWFRVIRKAAPLLREMVTAIEEAKEDGKVDKSEVFDIAVPFALELAEVLVEEFLG